MRRFVRAAGVVGVVALAAFCQAAKLDWNRSTDARVIGFRIYMGQGSRSYSQVIDVGTNTTATVTNLTPGVTYYFAATAYTATRLESDFSAEVSYMLELPVEPPTGFTVTNDISFAVMQSLNLLEWTEISSFTVPATNPAMYFKLQGPR